MADEEKQKTKKSCCTRFKDWVGSPSFYIYLNFFLGAWGDRMWSFSVGLFLVALSKGLLRLAAIYGLCVGVSVLMFGGLLGDWVDRNPRLKVIRISLFFQNFSVMLSAIAVCLTLYFEDVIDTYWDGGMKMLCEACIVTFAIIAQLASVAYKISLQKDWIVEVAGGKKSTLANLNAVMRALDLSCKVLAPTSTGIIMSAASLVVSAIVIAGWNLVSVFVEYALLTKVYNMVPSLANKNHSTDQKESDTKAANHEKEQLADTEKEVISENNKQETTDEALLKEESLKENVKEKEGPDETDDMVPKPKKKKKTTVELIFDPFISVFRSWRIYVKQQVVYAGLSLSFLYMTVLGFDSITVGFIYTNGVTELLAGISMALAGATGILGTFIFTRLRPRIGLERTGLFAYFFEVAFLSLCVVSIWAPGSPFDPYYKPGKACTHESDSVVTTPLPSTVKISDMTLNDGNATHNVVKRDIAVILDTNFPETRNSHSDKAYINLHGFTIMDIGSPNTQNVMPSSYSILNINKSEAIYGQIDPHQPLDSLGNLARHRYEKSHIVLKRDVNPLTQSSNQTETGKRINNGTDEDDCVKKWKHDGLNISVILLLIGIVTSRVGLWMADLTVTQILQENVPEKERGAVGGVQSSLNMFFDLLKFIVVIFVPHIETFGYLIIMSYTFICCAGFSFAFHSYRVRGHLFHCRAFWCYCCDKNNEKPLDNGNKITLDVKVKDELGTELKDMKKNDNSQGLEVV